MLREFLSELWGDWVALGSGIASFLLAAASAFASTSFSPSIFWPIAYVCLVVAAYRLWAKQYQATLGAGSKPEKAIAINGFIEKVAAFQTWLDESPDSELYRRAKGTLMAWDKAVQDYLGDNLPGELKSYIGPFPPPIMENDASVLSFLTQRRSALEAIAGRIRPENQLANRQP